MKKSFLVYLNRKVSKKNHFIFICTLGCLVSLGSCHTFRANRYREQVNEKQSSRVVTTVDEKVGNENELIKETFDPVSLIIEYFESNDRFAVQKKPTVQQLERETEQLATTFVKEKNKLTLSSSSSTAIKEGADRTNSTLEHDFSEQDAETWQAAQLLLSSAYHVVTQHSIFEPSDYFKVIPGTDHMPTISYTKVDTAVLGEQQVFIQVSDSNGHVVKGEFTLFVNHLPKIIVEQPLLFHQIGQSLDLRSGVSAFDYEEGELTSAIRIETNVDIDVEGNYEVVYSVTDQHGAEYKSYGEIRVINDEPIILSPLMIEQAINEPFNILNHVESHDREDGHITLNEKNIVETNFIPDKEGNYYFKIGNVKDQHGKSAVEKTIEVFITNEAPKILQSDMKVNVFSNVSKEDYLSKITVSDREDHSEKLIIEIDDNSWRQINMNELGEYVILLRVTDTNGKSTEAYGVITVINEPPIFLGVADREISIGEPFDPLEGITIYDKEEKLIPEAIEVTGLFDHMVLGTHIVYLSISDSFGQVTTSYELSVIEDKESLEVEK